MKKINLTWIAGALLLGGCATGMSHVQNLAKEITPLDAAAAAGGLFLYNYELLKPWEARITPLAPDSDVYRVTLKHNMLSAAGDGDAGLVFRTQAEKIAADHACAGYRVMRYEERLETVAFGARRVVEGIVECVKT